MICFGILLFLAVYRYVATELATDVVVNVGDVKFFLHKVKFNLYFQELIGTNHFGFSY